jgi:hypothetical protein
MLTTDDLYIAYHIVRGKPVMKRVGNWTSSLEGKTTYWIKYDDQNNVVTAEDLKDRQRVRCSCHNPKKRGVK